ncbi:MAG: hypothetical protein Q7R95_06525 [bacterium]|nr:hypothetical protein [bacterium]
MLNNSLTKIYDGDYEVIFSDTVNVYENSLTITHIQGYTFQIIFDKESFDQNGSITSTADEDKKIITVSVKSFRNQLGSANIKKLPVIRVSNDQQIYFSIYGKILKKELDFLNITINFYLK